MGGECPPPIPGHEKGCLHAAMATLPYWGLPGLCLGCMAGLGTTDLLHALGEGRSSGVRGVPQAALAMPCKAGASPSAARPLGDVCSLLGLSKRGAGSMCRMGSHLPGLGAGPASAGEHLEPGSACLPRNRQRRAEQAAEG